MPTAPRQRFDNRLNKLHREHRRSWADYSKICPRARARSAISQIEEILERDIATHAAIFRAQNDVADVLAYVAFSLENLTTAEQAQPDMPTKYGLRRFLATDVSNLIFVVLTLPPKDKDAIRRAARERIKPVLRRGADMLRPLIQYSARAVRDSSLAC